MYSPLEPIRKRRVCYTANAPHIGGGNRVLLQIWKGLQSTEFEPIAYCPGQGQLQDAAADLGVRCESDTYPPIELRRPIRSLQGVRNWKRRLLSHGVQAVHANDIHGARSVSVASYLLGLPLICHIHFPPECGALSWAFRGLPKPDAFIFCSQSVREEVGGVLSDVCPRSQQRVILNATEIESQAPPRYDRSATPRIGIVANLNPVKGHLHFFQMADELTRRGRDAEYWVVGGNSYSPGYLDELQAFVRSHALTERVRFLGHRDDVSNVLQLLDVVVCPSLREPFGLCVIEAMAAGKPVVASRVGGIPEIITDDTCGILVEPGNAQELADAVDRLLHDDSRRESIARTARRRVETSFSTERYAADIVGLYRELLAPRKLTTAVG